MTLGGLALVGLIGLWICVYLPRYNAGRFWKAQEAKYGSVMERLTRFYPDHLTVTGEGVEKTVPYTEIADIRESRHLLVLVCHNNTGILLEKSGFSDVVCRELHMVAPKPELADWEQMVERIRNRSQEVHIGLVGKYVKLHDAYLSVAEAMNHAGYELNAFVKIHWIDSEVITKESVKDILKGLDGIIIPGGFGNLPWYADCRD